MLEGVTSEPKREDPVLFGCEPLLHVNATLREQREELFGGCFHHSADRLLERLSAILLLVLLVRVILVFLELWGGPCDFVFFPLQVLFAPQKRVIYSLEAFTNDLKNFLAAEHVGPDVL